MYFGSLHVLDVLVVLSYLVAVVWIGRSTKLANESEEGFFLAGRKLGKTYQFFLNFGNATEPQGAVATASFVFQQGISGSWLAFQTVFTNPYLWFMVVWFRRVRLMTVSDLFVDRFGDKGLGVFYALFQILVACVFLGFGNITAYKIASSLAVKPAVQWTTEERASVEGFHELQQLERANAVAPLNHEAGTRLQLLRDRNTCGELRDYVTIVNEWMFYGGFALVLGVYILLGGMEAAAAKDVVQSVLIVVFSLLLIPTGLESIGGWHALSWKVPKAMFHLFGSTSEGQFTLWGVVGVVMVSVVQNSGLSHNMGIYGSAKDESAVRWGVGGTYLKRVMIILWAFTGLIAVALFGVGGVSDPDAVWGTMSRHLLGPGLVGLMFAGVLAGSMSTLSARVLAIASLLVRNVYRVLKPDLREKTAVSWARWSIVALLGLGVLAATIMGNFFDVVKMILTINLPFGAAIMLIFWWRRITARSVWCSVILTTLVIVVVPWAGSRIPALANNPALTHMSSIPGTGIYFTKVVHRDPLDSTSPLVAAPIRGNVFNVEAWLTGKLGIDVESMTAAERYSLQYLFDAVFPFLVLIAVSLITRPSDAGRVAYFYGKMKTPVGNTPDLENEAMAETTRNPERFDHTKLFPGTNWEFCRWTRSDAIGFVACIVISLLIVGAFTLLLSIASG